MNGVSGRRFFGLLHDISSVRHGSDKLKVSPVNVRIFKCNFNVYVLLPKESIKRLQRLTFVLAGVAVTTDDRIRPSLVHHL